MNITEQAANELKKVLDGFDNPRAGIRIFSGQGCCGQSIQMDIAPQPKANETVVNLENIQFFVADDLFPTIEAVTIEYGQNGFKLNGLKESGSSCCG